MRWNHIPVIGSAAIAAMVLGGWGFGLMAQDESKGTPQRRIVEDSMHEFMEYVFQPTYRRLKSSVASEPQSNADWKSIKSDSLILAESCNLLFDRTPKENGADWNQHAAASRDAGAQVYQAARDKSYAQTVTAWRTMLEHCNACHRQFEDGKHILKP